MNILSTHPQSTLLWTRDVSTKQEAVQEVRCPDKLTDMQGALHTTELPDPDLPSRSWNPDDQTDHQHRQEEVSEEINADPKTRAH